MDNRIFDVNGRGPELLLSTLRLAFQQQGTMYGAEAWLQTVENGLVLLWSDSSGTAFPGALSADECMPIVEKWLASDFAATVPPSKWCTDADHDGHNEAGWQVYVGDWGHVGAERAVICAIKPAFCWYGK